MRSIVRRVLLGKGSQVASTNGSMSQIKSAGRSIVSTGCTSAVSTHQGNHRTMATSWRSVCFEDSALG